MHDSSSSFETPCALFYCDSSYVNVTRMHGSRAHCITFVDEEMGVLKFKGYTEQVGTTGGWVYVQEGDFVSSTLGPPTQH